MSVTTYAGCSCCGQSGSGSGGGSGSGSGPRYFDVCVEVPANLQYTAASDDIACLDGHADTMVEPSPGVSPFAWADDNLPSPCSTGNGLAIRCTGAASWTATYNGGFGTTTTLEENGGAYLLFRMVSDGSGAVPAGTAFFLVTLL